MRFGILGPLEISDGKRAVALRGARERAVLAYLLLHAGHVVPTDVLIDKLWGEEPAESARKSLQVRVAGLRKALAGGRIVTRAAGYLIRVERGELDLDRFEQLLEDAGAADPAVAAALLDEALELWRGPPLADFRYESWAQPAIARLEELRLIAQESRIDAALALGKHDELVGGIEALVAEHSVRERLRSQLMLALYRSGRQVEALDVFQHARDTLVEELGIEPGPALTELHRAILQHDPSLDLEPDPNGESPRAILVTALADKSVDGLLALAEPLAAKPRREVIVVRPNADADELGAVSAHLHRRIEPLLAGGLAVRAAAFNSAAPARDIVRLATAQNVDLLLVDAGPELLADPVLATLLVDAPCDVAVFTDGALGAGPVVVPFTGADHDWTAIELGAWLARALGVSLRLAGPREEQRDASRLLADASLAVQRALGVPAEPLLVAPSPEALVDATRDATAVVAGLSDRWRAEGIGRARSALIEVARRPVLLVRSGLRPGGLAPRESYTRFTWTIRT
jgi:DNA-binding SARP family transcriptional activator